MLSTIALLIVLTTPVKAGSAIMVHGAGGGGWEYDFWAKEYRKAGWTVIARDLVPAKGGLENTRFEDYVSQVESWRPKSKRPLVLIGASMGGPLVLKAAEQLKPDAIVLVNAAPPKGFWNRDKQEPMPSVVKWANGPLKDTEDSMPDSDRKTILWAWKKWRDESGQVMDALWAGVPVTKPTCPVLVIIGTNDTDIPPAISLNVADAFHADVFRYTGMSHVGPLMSTRAVEVAQNSLKWLERRISDR
jgi:pimeloyl-ACP methyl ester carboxylesterase